jgi:hypothetical protein
LSKQKAIQPTGKKSRSLDRTPTPEEESKDFENPDEKMLQGQRAHELDVLSRKQGIIGKLTGSENSSLNTALVILLCLVFLLAASMFYAAYFPEPGKQAIDNCFKAILAVAGYIFGVQTGGKN